MFDSGWHVLHLQRERTGYRDSELLQGSKFPWAAIREARRHENLVTGRVSRRRCTLHQELLGWIGVANLK